ncbi:MAG: RNase adapter RapZ [Coriobacteriales bacterium]|nr:RNase adapter RapZ [Coriobacteriales bacterium]
MPEQCPPDVAEENLRVEPELVLITGMSGAGRSEALHTFEDLGYFCIDNLPPSFMPQLVELAKLPGNRIRRICVASDVRSTRLFSELGGQLARLEDEGLPAHVIVLEAEEDTLVNRFKATRRRHPLCDEGGSLLDEIRAERAALGDIRERADVVIDTSDMRPQELRQTLKDVYFTEGLGQTLSITVSSFGFKYGVPTDADIMMDVRFLPNPYYISDLRDLNGLEAPVIQFVLERPETILFLEKWLGLLDVLMPGYIMEGKHHLSIAVGCTGGMHRSVTLAEETARFLRDHGYRVAVSHRDIGRDLVAR